MTSSIPICPFCSKKQNQNPLKTWNYLRNVKVGFNVLVRNSSNFMRVLRAHGLYQRRKNDSKITHIIYRRDTASNHVSKESVRGS